MALYWNPIGNSHDRNFAKVFASMTRFCVSFREQLCEGIIFDKIPSRFGQIIAVGVDSRRLLDEFDDHNLGYRSCPRDDYTSEEFCRTHQASARSGRFALLGTL